MESVKDISDINFGVNPMPVKTVRADAGRRYVQVLESDLMDLLTANLEAAQEAIMSTGGIDFIEEHGGPESEDTVERIAYHLYYGLFAAERLRVSLIERPKEVAP